jgi:zinc D-Ala-D-Ala carboxypeptidase
MQLSKNFKLNEFTASQTATRKGIDNTPAAPIIERLRMLANTLEQVRNLLGDNSIRISSGYRCLALNRAIGSSDSSAHVQGYAVDFTCPGFGTPKEVANKIAQSDIKYDQIILEGISSNNSNGIWIHLSVDPRNRRDILSAKFKNGKAIYTKGII